MEVDFNRFLASDGVELQSWYSDVLSNTVVIHVHGKSGNGYENQMERLTTGLSVLAGSSIKTRALRLDGASHSFRDYENKLADLISSFIQE